jgi:hypothetical protein
MALDLYKMQSFIKYQSKYSFSLSLVMTLTSCRSEETEFINTPPEDVVQINSTVADLIQRTASNGSNDNIIDFANCFNIKLPINITVKFYSVNTSSTNIMLYRIYF